MTEPYQNKTENCCNSVRSEKIPTIKEAIKNKIEHLGKRHDEMYTRSQDLRILHDMLPTNMTDWQEQALHNLLDRSLNCID